ncbi:MAG: glycosyltransferase family 1 protein [Gammaproteobacteria bacterium]|nr:glycosyltransferase family 1 protein [Gammaproteobacteria bacterium]
MSTPELKLPITELAAERLRGLRRRQRAARLRLKAMSKAFTKHADERLLLITQEERIPQSQIFPFHHYAGQLADEYGAEIREADLDQVLSNTQDLPAGATIIAFQTPYDISDDDLFRLLDKMREAGPDARMVYLDWSAPTDLRNAERLNSHIDLYVKKHALQDRSKYGTTTLGDTNLADHYSNRLNIDEQEYTFAIPDGFMSKLIVGPSFVTAPLLLPQLLEPFDPGPSRPIDLHARFAVNGTPWYQAMRSEAETALQQFSDLWLAVGNTLPLYRFLAELRRAKVCFSPFGYGEVCWRDYEAVMAGTVILKPDMSHIETQPDIFRPWETYVPLRWDLADFDDTLRKLLADEDLRHSIAANAHTVLHEYLKGNKFVGQMQPLFSGSA